ncbi:VOC family protein [Arthrobacter sp. L77]|uniref:VOC family protein n=1 Tax=Arthrobacter sp. L77 TaxID=1496689 RepID=UPI0005B8BC7D|nr:VOC family protein [Arthrobacter sp. L77]
MPFSIQVSIDCSNAHAQADWWAETLGWVVEPTDEAFIDRMIAQGHARESDVVTHNGSRVWRTGAGICRADDVGRPGRERILFQPVPEPKTTKNRVHLDVDLAGADRDTQRARLEARGARYVEQHSQGPYAWYVMLDPEGNEFCIA